MNKGRGNSLNKGPLVNKVEKIELNEKHLKLRVVIFVVAIIVAIFSFGIFISSLLNVESGWTVIEEINTSYPSIGSDFIFTYNIPKSNPTAAKKNAQNIYSNVSEKALVLLDESNSYDGYKNVHYINKHINEDIKVDPMLYDAFKLINEYNDKTIFLAPVYDQYSNLLNASNDVNAKSYDPKYSDDMKEYFKEICNFVNNDRISLSILDDSKIRVNVESDYLEYCEENNIESFINFHFLKNAIACDYMANELIKNNITGFILSSNDGYNYISSSNEDLELNLWRKENKVQHLVGRVSLYNSASIITLNDSPITGNEYYYYLYYDKTDQNKVLDISSKYIDLTDGISKTSTSSYCAYSESKSVSELMILSRNAFICDEINADVFNEFKNKDIYYLYLDSNNGIHESLNEIVTFKNSNEN